MKKKNTSLNLPQKALTPKASNTEKFKKIIVTPKATLNKENLYHRSTPKNDAYGFYPSTTKNIQHQSASLKYLLRHESSDEINNDYLLKDFEDESFKINEFNKGMSLIYFYFFII